MKKRNLFLAAVLTVSSSAVLSQAFSKGESDPQLSDLQMENVEALSSDEWRPGEVELLCDGSHRFTICVSTCSRCFREYTPSDGSKGKCLDARGVCKCGSYTFKIGL